MVSMDSSRNDARFEAGRATSNARIGKGSKPEDQRQDSQSTMDEPSSQSSLESESALSHNDSTSTAMSTSRRTSVTSVSLASEGSKRSASRRTSCSSDLLDDSTIRVMPSVGETMAAGQPATSSSSSSSAPIAKAHLVSVADEVDELPETVRHPTSQSSFSESRAFPSTEPSVPDYRTASCSKTLDPSHAHRARRSADYKSTGIAKDHSRHHGYPRGPKATTSMQPARTLPVPSAEAIALVHAVNSTDDLYLVLGLSNRRSDLDDIRRAYISRSRICHPDKLPSLPAATSAFQRLSFAYETLSKPQSRRIYDLQCPIPKRPSSFALFGKAAPSGDSSGSFNFNTANPGSANGDETLNGVLSELWAEFVRGDFEMIKAMLRALSDGNGLSSYPHATDESRSGTNGAAASGGLLTEESWDSIESVFKRMRDLVLSGQKYLTVIRFELIRLYEIQYALRQLGWFNFGGRLRLTVQLARVTVGIPMALDKAMREEQSTGNDDVHEAHSPTTSSVAVPERRGLLGQRGRAVLDGVCGALERGERWIPGKGAASVGIVA